MTVSYSPKKGKNLLLFTTAHEDPDIHPEAHKKEKPIVIDFYNSPMKWLKVIIHNL